MPRHPNHAYSYAGWFRLWEGRGIDPEPLTPEELAAIAESEAEIKAGCRITTWEGMCEQLGIDSLEKHSDMKLLIGLYTKLHNLPARDDYANLARLMQVSEDDVFDALDDLMDEGKIVQDAADTYVWIHDPALVRYFDSLPHLRIA
jgi:hypothetical protein